ncbi:calcium-binding protein [Thalassococcus lentus]|uniref:M10 family metallopeptidase C-terminal domain-containing protein n=1 Tax=Thalassococcus lentus TaxID=1210524 RepID=A0ABT4XRU5_9RHOB|nr:M10 family metallopeptidase C-terminal domain-containing protein [Thalassococcus lentus]MDA7424684.1 M10 family metallopeptidase C-terminal domain-containing protein [Thalassococcus lentus]
MAASQLFAPFVATTQTGGPQRHPDISTAPDGSVAMVWEWENNDRGRVLLRIFEPDGSARTGEIRVDIPTDHSAGNPAVLVLTSGVIAVAWLDQATDGGPINYMLRLYDAEGNPLSDPITVMPAQQTRFLNDALDLAQLSDGTIIYVGEGISDGQSQNAGIVFRQLDQNGAALGDIQLAFDRDFVSEYHPHVAALENGGFVITASGDIVESNFAVNTYDFQVFGPDLQPVDVTLPSFEIPSDYFGGAHAPQAAGLVGGGLAFAVNLYDDFGEPDGVSIVTLDASGNPGNHGLFQTFGDSGAQLRGIVGTPDGGYAALLVVTDAGFDDSLRYLRVDAAGDVVIDTPIDVPTNDIDVGSIALAPDGRIYVAQSVRANTSGIDNDVYLTGFGPDLFGIDLGDDMLVPQRGPGEINGQGGTDTADYSNAGGRVLVDLDRDVSGETFVRFFEYGAASGNRFVSIENIIGGDHADNLRGDSGANHIAGGGVSDRLYGREGNDTLDGGSGFDAIFGNNGADTMIGGSGADRFIFFRASDSGVGDGNRDVITDFVSGEDRIEISRIDADLTTGGKQGFDFIGDAAFTGTGGELRYEQVGGNTIVQADRDGDGAADFEIELTGITDLTESDFLI